MSSKFVAHEVYAEQLGKLTKGFPLWFPEPLDVEVEVGDVGLLLNGEFKRLFNAVDGPAEDSDLSLEGFEPLQYNPRLCSEHKAFLDAGPVTNANVKDRKIEFSANV